MMKKLIIYALCCAALMARGQSTPTLNLSSTNLATGITTSDANMTTVRSVLANTNGNVLVIGTFSNEAKDKDSDEGAWQLEYDGQTSIPIKRTFFDKDDVGIASVVHVFTNVDLDGQINFQHSSIGNKEITTLGVNLVAIPLTVSTGETLNYGLDQQSSAVGITDNTFVSTGLETSVPLGLTISNGLYMAASFNSEADGSVTGVWQLQYRKGSSASWIPTGSEVQRAMSSASDTGAVTLYGLVEGLEAGEGSEAYEVRLVCKSDGTETVTTLNATLAAVALSYTNATVGGYFDGFSVTDTSLSDVADNPNYTGVEASLELANTGSGIFASMNFTGSSEAIGETTTSYDLYTLTGPAANQANQRYYGGETDYGSAASAGYFSGLGTGTHSIYGRYDGVAPSIPADVTLVGFATEATVETTPVDNDIGITKTVTDSTPAEGQSVQFTLRATNLGVNDATSVTVSDQLPDDLTYVSDNGGGSYDSGTGVWAVGALAAGNSATLKIIVTINASTAGTSIINTATVPEDDNNANNEATAVVTIYDDDCGVTFLVADNDGITGSPDYFTKFNRASSNETAVGATGTDAIEAIALNPTNTVLYAADGGDLGSIDTTSGSYTRIGSFGTGGNGGTEIAFNDVDGLSFDPLTGKLYGSVRRSGSEDLLIQINPATGAHVPEAFGTGLDYVVINAVESKLDIDDIAIDSYDGQMYAIANNGGAGDRLVTINKSTGFAEDVGLLRDTNGVAVIDHEGLSFDNDGQLYGTTGGGTGYLYDVNKATGVAIQRGTLSLGTQDYEASESLTCPPNWIEGTVFLDANADAVFDNGDSGTSGITVNLYRDLNLDGVPDPDEIVATTTTDSNGEYAFVVASTGAFLIDVDTTTLPAGHFMTTDNIEVANFGVTVGKIDSGNDFGYIPSPLSITKTSVAESAGGINTYTIVVSNAVGAVTQTGIEITDTLFEALTYVSGSTVVIGYSSGGVEVTKNNDPGGLNNLEQGVPPVLVVALDGFELEEGKIMTVILKATVPSDTPFNFTEIPNTAGVRSAESPTWQYGSVTNTYDPLSSGIDLRAYQTAEGVLVEFVAFDVEDDGTIKLSLLDASGAVIWSGSVDVTAGPRFFARFQVPGLELGQDYDFRVRDEVGNWWEANGVTVESFEAEMTSASLAGVTLLFDSLPDRAYEIQWAEQLGSLWQTVTNVPSQGEQTSVVVLYPETDAASGFFKIILK